MFQGTTLTPEEYNELMKKSQLHSQKRISELEISITQHKFFMEQVDFCDMPQMLTHKYECVLFALEDELKREEAYLKHLGELL